MIKIVLTVINPDISMILRYYYFTSYVNIKTLNNKYGQWGGGFKSVSPPLLTPLAVNIKKILLLQT